MKELLKDKERARELEESFHVKESVYLDLPKEGFFDLGKRKVFFFETPGHTLGSICLYDEKCNVLFSADTLCDKGVLLGFEESSSVSEYRQTLLKIKEFCEDHRVNTIYPGHHESPVDVKRIDDYLCLCEGIISEKITGVYKDTGTCEGYYVSDGKISLIYKQI